MKCLLLCGGYATRLYPLTENYPKALLDIEPGKPLLNYVIEKVNLLEEIDDILLVTNESFYQHFRDWGDQLNNSKPITIINDHTTDNEHRLGANGDIQYAVNLHNIYDDLLIILGDNLFDFDLDVVIQKFKEKKAPIIIGREETDINLLRRLGVIEKDGNDQIIGFEEKPADPKGSIISYGIYIYPKEVIAVLKQYLEEGNKSDKPGDFVTYLYQRMPSYAYSFEGNWFDIGTLEGLQEVKDIYCKR